MMSSMAYLNVINVLNVEGFAFIEYPDAHSCLAAIRALDGYILNSRRLKVSFSAKSNLKEFAREAGIEVEDDYNYGTNLGPADGNTVTSIEGLVSSISLPEAYDILHEIKALAHADPRKARDLFDAHPSLVPALMEIEVHLHWCTRYF